MKGKANRELSVLSRRDEKALYAILTDPVKWGELFLRNRDGSQRRYWDHQKGTSSLWVPRIGELG